MFSCLLCCVCFCLLFVVVFCLVFGCVFCGGFSWFLGWVALHRLWTDTGLRKGPPALF